MAEVAIIGGTGLTSLSGLHIVRREMVKTPFGKPSCPVVHGILSDTEVVFLPRHGVGHTIPPHQINYRANIWALKQVGVQAVLAVNAVGGIHPDLEPGQLMLPDQIIDYTWSRGHTFFEHELTRVVHIDFTNPYSARLRDALCEAASDAGIEVWKTGTYATTQGPRLETAAEIDRLERDGCDVVGMTGMPEAALAKELSLEYAACAVIVNHAAGRGPGEITMEIIQANLGVAMQRVHSLLEHVIPLV